MVCRASRIARGSWLLQHAEAPMSTPLTTVMPHLNALGMVKLRAAMMACMMVACD